MKNTHAGFIQSNGTGKFSVDWRRIAPESYLATCRLVHEIVLRRELAHGDMLDIGCGTKPYAPVFGPYVRRHVGIDMPFSLHEQSSIDVYGSAVELPILSGSFDFVLCTEVLEHLPEPQRCLSEISRVLKPGGVAIVTSPFMYRIHEAPYDFFRYTPFSYRYMAKVAGLEVVEIAARGGLVTVLCDLLFKSCSTLFGALNRVYQKLGNSQTHLLRTRFAYAVMLPPQMLLGRMLQKEVLKSNTYTLGYVVVLRKT